MKKKALAFLSLCFFAVVIIFLIFPHTISEFYAEQIPQDIADKKYCGNTNKTIYKLANDERTTFIIPDAYIGSSNMRAYIKSDREKGLYEFISLRIQKRDFSAVCDRHLSNSDVLHLSISAVSDIIFENKRKSRLKETTFESEEGEFNLYVNDYPPEKPWERIDYLVPQDTSKKNIYLKCTYFFKVNETNNRNFCGIYQFYKNGIEFHYAIPSEEVQGIFDSNKNVIKKIETFIQN